MSAAIPHNLLAEWLDARAPQGPPVELEAEVCEAVVVLWADRAAPPTVPVEALIGGLRFGPLSAGGDAAPEDEWSPRADEFLPEEEEAWGDAAERAEAAQLQALLAGDRGALRGRDVDAVLVALNPNRAAGPQVDLEALVATVREGPLVREAEVVPFVAPPRVRSSHGRGWWLAAAGSLAMAAGLLLTVLPIAKEKQGSMTASPVPPALEAPPPAALPELAAADAPAAIEEQRKVVGGEGATPADTGLQYRKDKAMPGGGSPKVGVGAAPIEEEANAQQGYGEKKAEKPEESYQRAVASGGSGPQPAPAPSGNVPAARPAPPPPPPSAPAWIPEVAQTGATAETVSGDAGGTLGLATGTEAQEIMEDEDEEMASREVVVAKQQRSVEATKPARSTAGRGASASGRPSADVPAPQSAPAQKYARDEVDAGKAVDATERTGVDDSVSSSGRWETGEQLAAAGDRLGAEAAWSRWLTDPDPEVAVEAAYRVGRSRLRAGDVAGARAVVTQGLARVDASAASLARLRNLERQITLRESRAPAGPNPP